MKQKILLLIFSLFVYLLSKEQINRIIYSNIKFYEIKELYNQDISLKKQNVLIEDYNKQWLNVWKNDALINSKEQIIAYYKNGYSDDILESKWKLERAMYFGENKLPYSINELKELVASMDLNNYPLTQKFGISCELISLRELPTSKPKFLNSELAGEGYPFDYFQISTIATNTPLKIIHKTKDGSWLLVETPNKSWGWVKANGVAIINHNIIKKYETTNKFVSIIKDNIALIDDKRNFITMASIGASFPLVKEDKEKFEMLVAVKDENGNSFLKTVCVSKSLAVIRGLDFNTTNFHLIMSNVLNDKYGWGGNFENRDCSQLFMDIFSVFGIWLPRDSKPQIEYLKQTYKYVQLSDTITTESYARYKEHILIELGVPYLTFIEMNGHIMLYCGSENDTAIVFQDVWGLRTNDINCRLIIGKVCLTDLWAGKDFIGIDKNYLWIKRIKGFVILGKEK